MIQCATCESTVASLDEAARKGWEPDFWVDKDVYVGQVMCRTCAKKYIDWDAYYEYGSGECTLKKDLGGLTLFPGRKWDNEEEKESETERQERELRARYALEEDEKRAKQAIELLGEVAGRRKIIFHGPFGMIFEVECIATDRDCDDNIVLHIAAKRD